MQKQNQPVQKSAILDVIETVRRLRAPGGCPWDREQTHQSLRPYLIEEAHEVLDVLDQVTSSKNLENPDLKIMFIEELGDLLMQVLLHSQLGADEGYFSFEDVARSLNEKLIRRHPHVFGEAKAEDSSQVLNQWELLKAKEKETKTDPSVLSGLPKGLPALQRASRVIDKVTHVGFKWKDLTGPLEKLEEEIAELKKEILTNRIDKNRVEAELGDVIFSVCNLASYLKIHPEDALRTTLRRFESRFRFVEKRVASKGKKMQDTSLEEMDVYWEEAKKTESEKKESTS